MTDELTPEERELLKSLSRERIPSSGLEDRVVGAMRERGFLGKRSGRMVRITNSRVAGLLAACIVLVIGAYSIGLHRGNDRVVTEPLTSFSELATPATPPETGKLDELSATDIAKPSVPASEVLSDKDAKAPPIEWKLKKSESPLPGVVYQEDAASNEPLNAASPGKPGTASSVEQPAASSPAPASRSDQQLSPPDAATFAREKRQVMSLERANPAGRSTLTFTIEGTTFVVDAPDSVRIVQEEHGRTLLIYTSDGLIRIRVAN